MKATSLLLNDAETADKLTEQALMRLDGMEQFMSPEAALLVAKQLQMLVRPRRALRCSRVARRSTVMTQR